MPTRSGSTRSSAATSSRSVAVRSSSSITSASSTVIRCSTTGSGRSANRAVPSAATTRSTPRVPSPWTTAAHAPGTLPMPSSRARSLAPSSASSTAASGDHDSGSSWPKRAAAGASIATPTAAFMASARLASSRVSASPGEATVSTQGRRCSSPSTPHSTTRTCLDHGAVARAVAMDRSTSTARSPDTRSTGRSSRFTSTSRPESAVRPTETSSGAGRVPSRRQRLDRHRGSERPDPATRRRGEGHRCRHRLEQRHRDLSLGSAGHPADPRRRPLPVAAALRTADTRSARSP